MTLAERINAALIRYSDLILAAGVVMIIGIMIVRVPPPVMDVFLAINISAAVTVLLVALYASEAIKLPSLPTILLLTTLFRLALNVSTTRLILLDGDAGEIIFAFGDFVVGGNYVVGAVVFLVLVLIQFIVIAKGSERVAEVSARFTLDAMPGKQMSIDADLRNGLIDEVQAKRRREMMDRESKLYGAMDGAMKFVKGDAIAGIVISLINIVGGLVIGVLQQGMEVGEAAQVYSLLTIGDGLVSQIPALLISVSAGLVVTRVAAGEGDGDDEDKGHLAGDIFEQVLDQPKGIIIVGVILLAFAGSSPWTGFPPVPFGVLGLLFIGVASARKIAMTAAEARAPAADGGKAAAEAEAEGAQSFAPLPLVLEIHSSLEPLLAPQSAHDRDEISRRLAQLRRSVSEALGVDFPPIPIRTGSRRLPEHGYAVMAYDTVLATGVALPDRALALCPAQVAQGKGLEAERAQLPGTTIACARIPLEQAQKAVEAGLNVMPPLNILLYHLNRVLRRNAAEFLGVQETKDMMDRLGERMPALVNAVMPSQMKVQEITETLKLLLREQVPIRDMRAILESLARWASRTGQDGRAIKDNPDLLNELVRRDLRRTICASVAPASKRLVCYALANDIERSIAEGPLSVEEKMQIRAAVARRIDTRHHLSGNPVLLVHPDLRIAVRELLEPELPDVSVLSEHEIPPDYAYEPVVVFDDGQEVAAG
ncbi:MAG: flagellar biosynthesis protein FlhA [Planctomycetota bacterium]